MMQLFRDAALLVNLSRSFASLESWTHIHWSRYMVGPLGFCSKKICPLASGVAVIIRASLVPTLRNRHRRNSDITTPHPFLGAQIQPILPSDQQS